jgi:hypothetical protein
MSQNCHNRSGHQHSITMSAPLPMIGMDLTRAPQQVLGLLQVGTEWAVAQEASSAPFHG